MRRFAIAVVLLLAVGAGAAAEDRIPDCVAGLCLGEPFAIDSAAADWEVADWSGSERCTRVSGGALPAGLGMMMLDGRIARFEIGLTGENADDVDVAPFGLRPGMSLAEAGARFPQEGLELDFHKYSWPPGLYLTWRDAARDRGVRVELPDGRVDVILWGTAGAVRLGEGCT